MNLTTRYTAVFNIWECFIPILIIPVFLLSKKSHWRCRQHAWGKNAADHNTISITYSEGLLTFIQHATRLRNIVIRSLPRSTIFLCITNGTIFGKKLLNTKSVFRFCPQILSETFLILRRNKQAMIKNVYWSACKVPLFLSDCNETWMCFDRYSENTKIFTYLLTPWCRVLLKKPTGLQLAKKFPAFHGTPRFITALTSVRHLPLSWAGPVQSIYPHPTSWRSILILSTHLRLGLPSGLFPSGFPTNTLYTPFSSPIRATCPVHLILLDFITRTISNFIKIRPVGAGLFHAEGRTDGRKDGHGNVNSRLLQFCERA